MVLFTCIWAWTILWIQRFSVLVGVGNPINNHTHQNPAYPSIAMIANVYKWICVDLQVDNIIHCPYIASGLTCVVGPPAPNYLPQVSVELLKFTVSALGWNSNTKLLVFNASFIFFMPMESACAFSFPICAKQVLYSIESRPTHLIDLVRILWCQRELSIVKFCSI